MIDDRDSLAPFGVPAPGEPPAVGEDRAAAGGAPGGASAPWGGAAGDAAPADAALATEEDDAELADLAGGAGRRLGLRGTEEEAPPEEEAAPALSAQTPREHYIVRVQSNKEERIRERLEARIHQSAYADAFGEVMIPMENVTVIKDGKKRTAQRKKFPGYLIVEMAFSKDTWDLVRETPGISDFVGATRGTSRDAASLPPAMDPLEVDKLRRGVTEEAEAPREVKIEFEHGDPVKIKEGPFENFEGVVGEINPAKGKLTVVVTIFGRATNVDLEYWQVERMH